MPIISDINQTIENLDLLKFVESKGEKPEKKHQETTTHNSDINLIFIF